MTARPQVQMNMPIAHDKINGVITGNVMPAINAVKSRYNEHQPRYPEDRNELSLKIQAYGYEIISAGLGFKRDKSGRFHIIIRFCVKPMPSAFKSDVDDGINENACSAILLDCNHVHSDAIAGIAFDASWLDSPLPQADPRTHRA